MQKIYLKRHVEIEVEGQTRYFHAGEQIVDDQTAQALRERGQVAVISAVSSAAAEPEAKPVYSPRQARSQQLANAATAKPLAKALTAAAKPEAKNADDSGGKTEETN